MVELKKPALFALLIFILIAALGSTALFYISTSRTFQLFGGLTYRIQTDKKIVALTFDDAPTPSTDEVLAMLAEKNVPATFYIVGKYAEEYPAGVKKIVRAGHEVGNHSYSHERLVMKSLSFIDSEIRQTNTRIRESGYDGPVTFRPPNGKKLFTLPFYLKRNGIETIMWDVEPDTYAPPQEGADKTRFLVNHTITHTRPGSIILLHPFCKTCQSDREAIPKIIDLLRAEGYEFVTVTDLLHRARL